MVKSKNNLGALEKLAEAGSKASAKRTGTSFLIEEEQALNAITSGDTEAESEEKDIRGGSKPSGDSNNTKSSEHEKMVLSGLKMPDSDMGEGPATQLQGFMANLKEYKTFDAQSHNIDVQLINKLSTIASHMKITKLQLTNNILQNWIDDHRVELKAYIEKQRQADDFL